MPSLTATVADLGLTSSLVGCTSFCVRPKGIYKQALVLGGTKDPDLDKVAALRPTHILVNDEENRREDIKDCHAIAKTISCMPVSISDSIGLIASLAAEFSVDATRLTEHCRALHSDVSALAQASALKGKSFLYLVWKNPYMAATANTFVSEAASLLGMHNVLPAANDRYPTVDFGLVKTQWRPDVVLFSSEPYPFRRRDVADFRASWGEDAPWLYIIDGQLCSWWGSVSAELLKAACDYLRTGEGALLKSIL